MGGEEGLFSCFSYSGEIQKFLNWATCMSRFVLEKGSHMELFLWGLVGLLLHCHREEENGFPYLVFGLCKRGSLINTNGNP